MPQLFCVLDDSGRSLLTRVLGDIQTPSFPTVGLLCTIATYSDGAGFEIDSFSSHNVNVVYRRCPNGLLFVLATSNGLVQTQLLKVQLQVIYDALLLLLGPAVLNIDKGSEGLRKRLRGVTCIDSLIANDALVPCLMLPVPQSMGLPLREKAALHGCLAKLATGIGSQYVAAVQEGHYLAATAGWWLLQPQETLLLQHLSTNMPEAHLGLLQAQLQDLPIHLSIGSGSGRGHKLLTFGLAEDVQLLVILDEGRDAASLEGLIDTHLLPVRGMFQAPLWMGLGVPQFSSLRFDMALVVERQPACATLLWGRRGTAELAGFNPVMSPTLRRQLGPVPPCSLGGNSSFRSVSWRDAAPPDSMQVHFKSTLDLLVTFALQSRAASLRPPVVQSSGHQDPSLAASAASQGSSDVCEEFHMTSHGSHMVALLDPRPQGLDVFLALPSKDSRAQALELAIKLKGIFCMMYISV